MKKMKRFKKVAVLLMATAMCFGMAGCNKSAGGDVPTGDVYTPTFSEISSDVEYVTNVLASDGKLNIMGQVYDNETYELSQKLITLDMATGEQTSKDIAIDGDKKDDSEQISLQTMAAYKDGYMAVRYHYTQPSQDEIDSGVYDSETSYDIAILDADFNIQSTISLADLQKKVEEDGSGFYVQYSASDAEGNIYISLDNSMYVLDNEGKEKFKVDFDNWINGMFVTSDGQVIVMYYNDQYDMEIAPVDLNTKTVGTPLENLPSMDGNSSNNIYPASDGKLYVVGSTKLFLYDMNTQTSEEILDWIACDINTNNLAGFAVLDDGSFVAVSTTYDYSDEDTEVTIELATIKKVPASSVKQKKNVTLAMLYMNYNMREHVIKFNRTNEEYRINIKTYVDDDSSNWEDAQTQFQADVASGTAGDFFVADGNISVDNLIAKGALADLSGLIDKDEVLNRDDFISNILDILSVDGKLYCVAESFYINTLVGKTSDVGTGKSWSFKDVVELVKSHPDSQLMQYVTKTDGLSTMVMYSMDSFYNSETGECKFDSEDFISLLELCNTFPKEYDYDSGESESTASLLRSGKVLLTSVNMSSFSDIQMYPALYGEPVNFIGFPTNSGSGSVVGFNNRFCVAAKSKNKEGAWAFIRSFLLPDNQNKLDWNLPVNKAAFEQKIADAMKEQDDNGGVTNSIWWYDDVEITIGPLTEEDAQAVRDMVYNATTEATYDQQLMNIITEEAEYYFNGEKSAQEIAGIIQSRAQLYIDENR